MAGLLRRRQTRGVCLLVHGVIFFGMMRALSIVVLGQAEFARLMVMVEGRREEKEEPGVFSALLASSCSGSTGTRDETHKHRSN